MEKEFTIKLKASTLDKIDMMIQACLQSGAKTVTITDNKTGNVIGQTTLAEITVDVKREISPQIKEQLPKSVKEQLKQISKKNIKSKKNGLK